MGVIVLRFAGLVVMMMASLLSFTQPVSAAAPSWSAVSIPGTEGYQLGPPGVDIRDLAVASDGATIYAAPGDSIADRFIFKSNDAGASWVAQNVDITADLVAVAPDSANVAAVARKTVPAVYLTTDGGVTWRPLGAVKGAGGSIAGTIHDIAISRATNGTYYLAVAGEEVGGVGNVWYCGIEAEKPEWQETSSLPGFVSTRILKALAFSPNFPEDGALVTVGETSDKKLNLQVFDFISQAWNTRAGLTDYPVAVVEYGESGQLDSASIALSPDYLAGEGRRRIAFVGLAVRNDEAAGGVYRIKDAACEPLLTGISMHSIAFDGDVLLAAAYDTNRVYRSTNPLAETPTLRPNLAMKGPGGEDRVVIAWEEDVVVAGTSGGESAFAVSTNGGLTFNDVSLVDTELSNLSDVAVSEDGKTIYLASDDGNDLSLWRNTLSWQRVLSRSDTTGYIIRLAPDEAEAIYLAEKDGQKIYHSPDGGDRGWSAGICPLSIQDLAVESPRVAYALNVEGEVARTRSAGLSWNMPVDTELDEDTGHTIVSGGEDILFAGSNNGYVVYSLDGGTSWEKITRQVQSGAGRVQVIPDKDYASNKMIYAASDSPGKDIMRWQIGSSSRWTDILPNTLTGGVYGLATEVNALYALEYNRDSKQSKLWQCLLPAAADRASESWESKGTSATTDATDPHVVFDASPQALKLSSGGKLWAIKTNGTQRLYRIDDAVTELVLQAPADGYANPVNRVTGVAQGITFRWEQAYDATEYELSIAQDEEFRVTIASITVASDETTVAVSVGPEAEGAARFSFSAGATYYWRVRITQPFFPISSEARAFHVESLEVTPSIIIVRPPPPVLTVPPPPAQVIPLPAIELPPTTPPPEIVILPAPAPSPPKFGYIWAIIAAGVVIVLTVVAYILMTFSGRFLIFWLRRVRYRWSRWRRKWFEGKYEKQPLPAADSLEQIEALLKQVTWTMDGPCHLFDAISYPQTVWAKKKDDCDGFAVLAAALLKQWQPESQPALVTAMLRPARKSHTVCAFNVPGAGLWFFDNYTLRRGRYRNYADIAEAVQGKARMVCWDVVEPDTLQTREFHVAT